ncbi:MAG TPA: hypothetical protein VN643_18540 [Pyrinomonadaceae bacterium]|nr:hypothetical protein [Pyrinomonadaceae bacterium]
MIDIQPSNPNSPDGVTPVDRVQEPCPCEPISAIKLVSLTFKSDHALLKKYQTDWKDGGLRFAKPEWTPVRHHPVSHTMNKLVSIVVEIEVSTSNACPETGVLVGKGPNGMKFEKAGVTFTPGRFKVKLTSNKKLAKKIHALDLKLAWETIGTSVPISPAKTANKIYVTYDKPFGSDVTLKRLAWAVDRCKEESQIEDIVEVAHIYINNTTPPTFNVATNQWPPGTPPIWLMLDEAHSGGSCIAHSNLLKHIVNILGVPNGALERVFSSTDLDYSSPELKMIAGRRCTPVVVVDKSGTYEWNYFEACLHIDGKWYPGAFGSEVFSSAAEVHKKYAASPNRLVYITEDGGPRRFFDRDSKQYSDPIAIPIAKCLKIP